LFCEQVQAITLRRKNQEMRTVEIIKFDKVKSGRYSAPRRTAQSITTPLSPTPLSLHLRKQRRLDVLTCSALS